MSAPDAADRRLTVAVVVKYFPPTERISGIIGFLSVLLRRAAQDLDVHVISYGDHPHAMVGSIAAHQVGSPFPIRAARAVQRLQPDAVIVVSGIYELTKAAAYFAPLAFGSRAHTVFLQATNVQRGRATLVRGFLERFDRVAGTSSHIVEQLVAAGRADATLLPPAVDVPTAVSVEHDIDVAFINHLNSVKGADRAIDIIERLRDLRPETTAAVAGTGELAAELHAKSVGVEWHGWLPDDERDALLRRSRVIVLPFRTSVSVLGVSQTVLEAMAHGTIVVGTQTPAISDAIVDGHTGILLPETAPADDFVARIADLLDDHGAQEGLVRRAREAAEARWSSVERHHELVDLVTPNSAPILQFFLGTKAQYIKTAPVIRAAIDQGVPFRLIDSGQHGQISEVMRNELDISEPDVRVAKGADITSIPQAMIWAFRISLRLLRPRLLRDQVFGGRTGICVVHGDTPSTLLAALLARRAGLQVAHLEAGLRSFNWLHPFPEELIRIIVMRMADQLFTPNAEATANLSKMSVRGEVFELAGNTTHEPLRDALAIENGQPLEPRGPALVTCHRVENLKHAERLRSLVDVVRNLAEGGQDIVFVVHGPTRKTLESRQLLPLLDHPKIEIRDLVDHATFVRILADAPFAIIDGGSIQEEAAVLGTPTLVWRGHTERSDGVGSNVVLCEYDARIVDDFIRDPSRWRRAVDMPPSSPSAEALRILLDRL